LSRQYFFAPVLAIDAGVRDADHTSDADKTILVGRLSDQAALSGVLTALFELHLPVSSVECLEAG